MSNEEIVARIQSGEQELMGALWDQIEKLVAWKVNRVLNVIDGRGGVSFYDLYNHGYLAMATAIETYQSNGCSFSTWFMYYLKTAFAEATGYRTQRTKNDPLETAVSLSTPIGEEEDACELMEFIPDPGGTQALENVEEEIWRSQLHKALEAVLSEIPENQSKVLRCRYYEGLTQAVTAQRLNISLSEARKFEGQGLKALRYHKLAVKIRPFYDFDYHRG